MKGTIALALSGLLAFTLGGASPGTTINDYRTTLAAIADAGHPAFPHTAQHALAVGNADANDGAPHVVALDAAPLTTVNPASYTKEQAHAGLAVFTANCQSCHGANLQGTGAPGVAGTEFLTGVQRKKWTLTDLRNLVVHNMPLNNPGTLTPEQYANVMAFLLASNCYPAGNTPFPQKDVPAFAIVHIGPVDGAKPADPKLGVCTVR